LSVKHPKNTQKQQKIKKFNFKKITKLKPSKNHQKSIKKPQKNENQKK
jgi:hypothetical protein